MIYLKDSYTKSFEEKILLVEGDKIITQDSSFYAQSGGQPGDKGVLEINDKKFNVINTVKHELGIAHVVDSENLNLSGQIKGHIDWDHRYRLMKMHTTMHLMCAALPYYVTGGSIGLEKSRIDFDLGEETFEFETLNKIINKENFHSKYINENEKNYFLENFDTIKFYTGNINEIAIIKKK